MSMESKGTWRGTIDGSAAFQSEPLPAGADDAPPAGGITRIVPWFGAKAMMAIKHIVPEIGGHKNYIEPFCGSCSVLMAKPQVAYETVNDLHGDLTHLLRCLQDEAIALWLYGAAARTCVSEGILLDARALIDSSPPPDHGEPCDRHRALAYLVQSWMMRNGLAGTDRRLSGLSRAPNLEIALRFNTSGGSPTVRWASMVESIPSWHVRLRSVMVLRRNAMEMLEQIEDQDGLAIYADPPYLPESRTSMRSGNTRASYKYEFEAAQPGIFGAMDDHDRLADLLRRYRKARVVVSYYAHERLDALYPGWNVLDCSQHKNMANGSKGRPAGAQADAPEVLLINGPSLAGAAS